MTDQDTTATTQPPQGAISQAPEGQRPMYTNEQLAANAQGLKDLRSSMTQAFSLTLSETDAELDRIIATVEHAKSKLPGVPNTGDVAMSMITKMGNIAKGIKEHKIPNIVGSVASASATVNLALEQAQRAQINALYSANAAQSSEQRIANLQHRFEQVVAFIGLDVPHDGPIPESSGFAENCVNLHDENRLLKERVEELESRLDSKEDQEGGAKVEETAPQAQDGDNKKGQESPEAATTG